jgi:hypothetical protein
MNYRTASPILFSLLLAHTALAEPKWFKGNTHTHSLWSDGNDFPEMIVDWYQRHGYDFLAISDHNVLHQGEKWQGLDTIQKRQRAIGRSALEKYRERFPGDWIETRKKDGEVVAVRIKFHEEYAPLFNKPGKFLLIQAEEISNKFQELPVHINAVNLQNVIPVQEGTSVTAIIRKILEVWTQTPHIETLTDTSKLQTELESILIKELKVEETLDEEVEKLLAKYEQEFSRGTLDRHKMFQMAKAQMAKEKGVIL